MSDAMLIGPVILDDHMTGHTYRDFLQNGLPEQLQNIPLSTRIAMYFQHDGAPSHYARLVMQHLNDTSHNPWIGRGSTINWPSRSPDLTLLDFCLWGWLKSKVNRTKVDTREELLDHVTVVFARHNALRGATRHVLTRVAADDGIFENVLY
jgi:hypothetical protein